MKYMKVQRNRSIDQNGNVKLDLNAAVYSINAGFNVQDIQIQDLNSDEIELFNKHCKDFGFEERIFNHEVNHENNHELWKYDSTYDKLNLEDYFLNLCSTQEQKDRVLYELKLYTEYNMTKLLRCMLWLVHTFEENNVFWGVGRGSSVSSYCLYLIGLHMVDSIKYDLDVHEFLKW